LNGSTLYICYFGVREPLVQTQVIPYLREIAKCGVRVNLLTFEPPASIRSGEKSLNEEKQALAADGINWRFRTYHKRFSVIATAYDILLGAFTILKWVRKEKIDVLHARAHIPLAMALLARWFVSVRLIFDFRGLMAEEYVDAGVWTEGSLPYRVIKKLENGGLRKADEIVVLTEKFKSYLVDNGLRPPDTITVVPCCVDFERGEERGDHEKSDRFELIYAGSVTGLYMLEEMGRFFLTLQKARPDAFFQVLTGGDADYVKNTLSGVGIGSGDFAVQKVGPSEVPSWINRTRAAISFRKPTFSQIAASPTKIAEYLSRGVPVVVNSGIGDMDDAIDKNSVGVVIDEFDPASYEAAVGKLLRLVEKKDTAERCVQTARAGFDLETVGASGYCGVYSRLLNSHE